MEVDSDSDSDGNVSMEFSDDTAQCLTDSMTMQIRDLQLERAAMREARGKLINKLQTYECIITSKILEQLFNYL